MKGTAAAFAAVTLSTLALAPGAFASGGHYVFDGGTANEQAQVRAALEAPRSMVATESAMRST